MLSTTVFVGRNSLLYLEIGEGRQVFPLDIHHVRGAKNRVLNLGIALPLSYPINLLFEGEDHLTYLVLRKFYDLVQSEYFSSLLIKVLA